MPSSLRGSPNGNRTATARQLPPHRRTPYLPHPRWNIAAGIAHPTTDSQRCCRIAHAHIYPAHRPSLALDSPRRQLAVHTAT
ncbi:DUF6083 domain-containing protein [Kitasatospora cinereorecta]|uniref:DUF6083 domain-containing protein n=1 Tax=Kitasatospora cinereorecta TaxID=285560 RepID=A0ABW0V9A2_9ACTN